MVSRCPLNQNQSMLEGEEKRFLRRWGVKGGIDLADRNKQIERSSLVTKSSQIER